MFKRLTALIMCLAILTVTSSVFAEDVYATKRGKKYHKENCRFIKNRDAQKIDMEEAKVKGLGPCGSCFGKTEEITKKETKNEKNDGLVYVTKSGKKYHKPGCRLIKSKDTSGLVIDEAESKSFTPCGKCFSQQQAKAK